MNRAPATVRAIGDGFDVAASPWPGQALTRQAVA
jgi:hypothetical protein